MRHSSGFSLTELIVTLLVIAILAAIAIPGYSDHLRRGSRAAAQSFLTEVASKQTQYLLDARNYAVGATALADLALTAPNEVATFYDVFIENSAGGTVPTIPPTFRVRATPKVGTRQAPDGELILAHEGTKTRNGSAGW